MRSRIEHLMKQEGVTQQRFAEMLGISAGSLSSILTGRTKPTANHVHAIHKVFPTISLNWLIFGEGEMHEEAAEEEKEPTLFQQEEPAAALPKPEASQMLPPQIIREVVYKDKPPRQIVEVRIFFDDGTFETFSGNGHNI